MKCPLTPFEPDDFDTQYGDGEGHKSDLVTPDIAAERANARLEIRWQEWSNKQLIRFGMDQWCIVLTESQTSADTHAVRIFDMKEIEKCTI